MKKFAKNVSIYLIIFALVLAAAFFYKGGDGEYKQVKYSTFANYLEQEKISEITIDGYKLTGKIGNGKYVYAYTSSVIEVSYLEETYIFPQMQEKKLSVETPQPSSGSTILSLLPTLIMVVALGFLFYLMMNQGGNGKAFFFF